MHRLAAITPEQVLRGMAQGALNHLLARICSESRFNPGVQLELPVEVGSVLDSSCCQSCSRCMVVYKSENHGALDHSSTFWIVLGNLKTSGQRVDFQFQWQVPNLISGPGPGLLPAASAPAVTHTRPGASWPGLDGTGPGRRPERSLNSGTAAGRAAADYLKGNSRAIPLQAQNF